MSSAVEDFESSLISEAAFSMEGFEFSDSEEDLELAKALEELDSSDSDEDEISIPSQTETLLSALSSSSTQPSRSYATTRAWEIGVGNKTARYCSPEDMGGQGFSWSPAGAQLPLRDVPTEVILKVLSCLSATDLSRLGQVSCSFRRASSDNGLWRRLFTARWGHPGEDRVNRNTSWKALYLERERAETEEILERSPIESATVFIEMQKAKRSVVLGVCQHSDLCENETETSMGKMIAKWLKKNGFPDASVKKTDQCPGPFIKIGDADAYVCEKSGWVHICDCDACSERVIDRTSGQLVCPVSGRTFERLMSTCEEQQLIDEDRIDENNEDFSVSGRLGRAYADGYNCADESELRRFCGVQLR